MTYNVYGRKLNLTQLQRYQPRTDLSSWHGFGIHDVSLDDLATLGQRTLQIPPQRCFAAATRTDDDHAHSLTELLVELQRFPNLQTARRHTAHKCSILASTRKSVSPRYLTSVSHQGSVSGRPR